MFIFSMIGFGFKSLDFLGGALLEFWIFLTWTSRIEQFSESSKQI